MSPQLQSSSFQTVETDFFPPGPNPLLNGQVTDLKVLDPTELNAAGTPEVTSLLEVDDEFDVQVSWELTGANTTVTGGFWVVSLYSDDMDGVGGMTGLIGGPAIIPIVPGVGPLTFQNIFQVLPPTPQVGLYKLVVTISHSPTGDPNLLTEMFGFAEATPINIRQTVVETT